MRVPPLSFVIPFAAASAERVRKGGATEELPGCCTVELSAGDRLRIETPGGGGYGRR